MEWVESTLGEICDLGGGEIKTGPFGSQLHQSDYDDEGTPVVMPKDIIDGRVLEYSIARVSDEHVERLSQHKLSEGDIVYGRRGDIGRQALVRHKESGWLCGTGCLRVTLGKESRVSSRFLHLYLKQPDVITWIANQAIGATMPNLNTSILRSVPIRYPNDYVYQDELADNVFAYNNLIENNSRRIAILEDMAQSLYREWFVKFRFPGYEDYQFKDSTLGQIPEGWEVKVIGDVAKVKGGKRLPKGKSVLDAETPYPYLRVKDFGANTINREGVKFIDEESHLATQRYTITIDDVYVSIAGTIGRVGIIPSNFNMAHLTENAAKVTEIINPYLKSYIHRFLHSEQGQKVLASRVGGSSQPKLALYKISDVSLLLPTEELLKGFNSYQESLRASINSLEDKNGNLKKQRDCILPKLISGCVEI